MELEVGARVIVTSYAGHSGPDSRYVGQVGTIQSLPGDDYVEVRLDSEGHLHESITLPCLPEELEVVK